MTVSSPVRAPVKVQAAQGAPTNGKLFSFGLLSDVQHADIKDGFSFHGVPRFYRHALEGLGRAVDHFKAEQVDFAVHLGDWALRALGTVEHASCCLASLSAIIDFHNSITPPDEGSSLSKSEQALQGVLRHFEQLGRPMLHMLGNHCLYNHPRQELNQRLGIDSFKPDPSLPHSHYTFAPCPGWRVIVIDGYDISLLGWPPGHPKHEEAVQILAEKNPNVEKNSTVGLEGVDRRFVKFGGGLGQEQLAWLERQLEDARCSGEHVIVCSHLCIHPKTCHGACLLYNYPAVLEVLQRYGGEVVVATLAGHAHLDGYFNDETGIHHRVCKAVLETPPGRDCFGVVDVYPDRLVVRGVDTFAGGEWVVGGGNVVGRAQHGAGSSSGGSVRQQQPGQVAVHAEG